MRADDSSTGYDPSIPFCSKVYYSGETVNNYINFSNANFRIINVAENNCIKIISEKPLNKGYQWNSSLEIDWYNSSLYNKINTWVSQNKIGDNNDIQVDFNSEDSHVALADFYVGAIRESASSLIAEINYERTETSTFSNGQSALWKSKLAIPCVTDYLKACSSSSIYSINTAQTHQVTFRNNCWMLLQGDDEWLINAKIPQFLDANAWHIITGSSFNSIYVTITHDIRPILYIKSDSIISGDGTKASPFKVEENWEWFDSLYPTEM
ncbi:MAG: hypothetical protein Q4G05_03855 [Clostridia bacterium]|nr:hypothetical protein [Clostridia bacterium]